MGWRWNALYAYRTKCFSLLSTFSTWALSSCLRIILLCLGDSVEFELCSLYSFPVNTSTFSCVSLSLFPLLLFESCALLLLENYTLVFRGQLGDKPVLPIRLPCKHIYDLLCSSLSLFFPFLSLSHVLCSCLSIILFVFRGRYGDGMRCVPTELCVPCTASLQTHLLLPLC